LGNEAFLEDTQLTLDDDLPEEFGGKGLLRERLQVNTVKRNVCSEKKFVLDGLSTTLTKTPEWDRAS
jgi:hypothetical protein